MPSIDYRYNAQERVKLAITKVEDPAEALVVAQIATAEAILALVDHLERNGHDRELHHFEVEQAATEALELIQPSPFTPAKVTSTRDVVRARQVLAHALRGGA